MASLLTLMMIALSVLVVLPSTHICKRVQVELMMGRFDTTTSTDYVQYDWTAVQYGITFTNTTTLPNLVLQDVKNVYLVSLYVVTDGTQKLIVTSLLETTQDTSPHAYTLNITQNIKLRTSDVYRVHVQKRTEALFGIVKLFGFELSETTLIIDKLPKQAEKSRIEFIGDSLSCGYGNEGVPPCPFLPLTENGVMSFPAITARTLDMLYNVNCWSGKGVVRNFADKSRTSVDPMPVYYPRTIANNATIKWDFHSYVPDVVVITLGTNDFSTDPRPTWDEYSEGYNHLIDTIKANYYPHEPYIICFAMGNIANYANYTKQVVEQRADKRIKFFSVSDSLFDPSKDYGCAGHPSVSGDVKIAQKLSEEIQSIIRH